jgi:hypothetical protein
VQPRTNDDLLAIPGMGPAKLASYGDAILRIVEGARVPSGSPRLD